MTNDEKGTHMKKYVAICSTLAALAWAGVAAADTPQGKLTGSATFGAFSLTIGTPITDGGTSYVGLRNDKSGNCAGDAGTVIFSGVTFNILCAHYVASSLDGTGPKMRFTWGFPIAAGTALPVFRISDGGPNLADDKVAWTPTGFPVNDVPYVQQWVNVGRVGVEWANPWAFQTLSGGTGFTITSAQ
jgi:hypothetical protein